MSSGPPRDLGRRQLLQGAARLGVLAGASAALSACGVAFDDIRWDDERPLPAAGVGPDERARRAAVADARALLALALAVAGAREDLSGTALLLAGHHREHLTALGAAGPARAPGDTKPAPEDPVPAWAQSEVRAAAAAASATGAVSPGLARLLSCLAVARVLNAELAAAAAGLPAPAPPPSLADPSAVAQRAQGRLEDAAQAALRRAVDAEHAAVYAYEVLGARLGEPEQRERVLAMLSAHAQALGWLQRLLASAQHPVPPAAPAYRLPEPGSWPDPPGLAVLVETRLAAVYSDVVAAGGASLRPFAAGMVLRAARHARGWGAPLPAFPGLADRSGRPAS